MSPNTHGAWRRTDGPAKDVRVAGGTQDHCFAALERHLARQRELHPDIEPSGYVRELTDKELS